MHRKTALAFVAAMTISGLLPATGQASTLSEPFDQALSSAHGLSQTANLPIDALGRPNATVLEQAKALAATLPPQLQAAVLAAVAYFEGSGDSDVQVPDNAPAITQFLWPTVAGACIGGSSNAVGSAVAVPGPTTIPAPGAGAGETAFVFTALGTTALAGEQSMNVQWFNIDSLQWGTTALGDHGINPEGPATLSGTAATGTGRVIAVVSGQVSTTDARCAFFPTAAIVEVK
ncbi:hypothetical protein PAB09_05185 [Corynebacterium sp. SCR221107]|uniref:Rv1157c family protein n=1 Tax=Corynebacterium sp. SCR221107 TaxID=3017361 RepID=UPI0022EC3248|nr:hypothetical protein [Corynebacterium sp. SCR221107]WBT09701.1 hypothetical protein PAB09_05185 [Corynebacterium sp. SCR221107]